MDDAITKAQGGSHYWLSHRQQFTIGARTHTIEMSVPVPVDATPEERARLIQEAQTGLKQIETQVIQQRSAPPSGASTSTPASRPAGQPASRPPTQPVATPSSPAAHVLSHDPREAPDVAASPANRPAPPRPPQQATNSPEAMLLPRPSARLTMPSTPGPMRNDGSSLKVPEFLSIVRDNFKLNSTEAMELLHVKSLRDINLNDALKRLRDIVEQNNRGVSPSNQTPDIGAPFRPDEKPLARTGNIATEQTAPMPAIQTAPTPSSARKASDGNSRTVTPVRETQDSYGFDEEDEDEQEEDDDLDFEEEDADPEGLSREMTPQQEAHAQQLLNNLRSIRGNKPANESRLKVLTNILIPQIDEDELQRLVRSLWKVPYLKDLKVDQVERLISWGKEDAFEDEVQMVLALL